MFWFRKGTEKYAARDSYLPKQVTLLFQIAQSLVKLVKARTVSPLLLLELLEHGVIAQGLDLPGH